VIHKKRLCVSGACFCSAGPQTTHSRQNGREIGASLWKWRRGRNDGTSTTTVLPALGAWKPAKDAGSHIPTATATAAVKLDATAKPAQIERFYRFSSRTEKGIFYEVAAST
jgi:hypothetical protein